MTTITLKYLPIISKAQTGAKSFVLPKVNIKATMFFIALSILLLSFYYVYEINNLTNGSYQIKKIENKISVLSFENKDLQTNFAKVSFLDSIQEKTQALNFEKTKDIKYLQIPQTSFARAK